MIGDVDSRQCAGAVGRTAGTVTSSLLGARRASMQQQRLRRDAQSIREPEDPVAGD